ncbi:hypothetical protein Pla8534_21520 [Lignipirellula cremea]|uniref:Uncharacterized protein n=2 Tax=Lignipirellula cremea TaxID=2528010 RepID=A0A518DRA2_9BACT|nr:hypothetical protein Pla8534_21520 [Lignipirellula cremea]
MISQITKIKVLYLSFGAMFACSLLFFLQYNSEFSFRKMVETRILQKKVAIEKVATMDTANAHSAGPGLFGGRGALTGVFCTIDCLGEWRFSTFNWRS